MRALFVLLIVLVCVTCIPAQGETSIQGCFHFDSTWNRKVYLSLIPTFNDMYTMTNDMIIAESNMDTFGNFSINTAYLPAEEKLYRIHISKKGDPPASLIIGGADQNHFFIVASQSSNIHLENKDKESLFQHISIKGSEASKSLKYVDYLISYLDSSSFGSSVIKKEFIAKAISEKLRMFADTCSLPLVSLYAIYKSKFESNYPVNQQFYKDYLDKWKEEKTSYFETFRAQIPISNNREWRFSIFISVIAFILGFFLKNLVNVSNRSHQLKLSSLSVQERKILKMIRMGKSNQEISDEYSISMSTVKSHISSIYSKLNIRSRKEAIDLKL